MRKIGKFILTAIAYLAYDSAAAMIIGGLFKYNEEITESEDLSDTQKLGFRIGAIGSAISYVLCAAYGFSAFLKWIKQK